MSEDYNISKEADEILTLAYLELLQRRKDAEVICPFNGLSDYLLGLRKLGEIREETGVLPPNMREEIFKLREEIFKHQKKIFEHLVDNGYIIKRDDITKNAIVSSLLKMARSMHKS